MIHSEDRQHYDVIISYLLGLGMPIVDVMADMEALRSGLKDVRLQPLVELIESGCRVRADVAVILPPNKKTILLRRLAKMCHVRNLFDEAHIKAGGHLKVWNRQPLVLEKPAGSSLHLARRYVDDWTLDMGIPGWETSFIPVVVERDWHAPIASMDNDDADWPMPFDRCAFEFRISGVRVISFWTESSTPGGPKTVDIMYGVNGIWLRDDFHWRVGMRAEGRLRDGIRDGIRTERMTKLMNAVTLIFQQVRAACIMMDARVAEAEFSDRPSSVRRGGPPAQVPAPCDRHVVVRLAGRHAARRRGDEAGGGGGTGRRQAWHMRRGSWRHYDRLLDNPDPDTRIVEQPNESGIWTTSLWVSWYMAGDPDLGTITKEYRA